jgi:hypothetical protein
MLSRRLRVARVPFLAFVFGALLASPNVRAAVAAAAEADGPTSTIALPSLDAPPSLSGTIDDSWSAGARVTLPIDYTNRRASLEKTDVIVARDGDAIDLAFDVRQKGGRIESQETNGSSVLSDDYVGVYSSQTRAVRAIKSRARTVRIRHNGRRSRRQRRRAIP